MGVEMWVGGLYTGVCTSVWTGVCRCMWRFGYRDGQGVGRSALLYLDVGWWVGLSVEMDIVDGECRCQSVNDGGWVEQKCGWVGGGNVWRWLEVW